MGNTMIEENPELPSGWSSHASLLWSDLFADVEVTAGSKTWKLHCAILVSRSTWFRKALTRNWVEASSRKINITEFEAFEVQWLINYLYTGQAPDVIDFCYEEDDNPTRYWEVCARLWHVADFFREESLMACAVSKAATRADWHAANLCTFKNRGGPDVDSPHFKASVENMVSELSIGVKAIYGDNKFGDHPFKTSGLFTALVYVDESVVHNDTVADLAISYPEFGRALLKAYSRHGCPGSVWPRGFGPSEVRPTNLGAYGSCDVCHQRKLDGLFSPYHMNFQVLQLVFRCAECVNKHGHPWRTRPNVHVYPRTAPTAP